MADTDEVAGFELVPVPKEIAERDRLRDRLKVYEGIVGRLAAMPIPATRAHYGLKLDWIRSIEPLIHEAREATQTTPTDAQRAP